MPFQIVLRLHRVLFDSILVGVQMGREKYEIVICRMIINEANE
ncbi:MAG: hypothetical protein ABRQ24_03125 [Syntrophomonadaceae bacterium]